MRPDLTGERPASQTPTEDRPPWGVVDMALALALITGGLVALGLALETLYPGVLSGRGPATVTLMLSAAEGGLLCVVWLFAVKKYRLSWASVGLRRPASSYAPAFALAALVGSLAFTGVYAALMSALGVRALIPEPLPSDLVGEGALRVVIAASLAVWVPFVEEVFFRGFLFGGLTARYGFYVGAITSSAAFALAHFSLATMLPIFVTGVLFAWVYHRTRSIWAPMAAHAGQNALAVLVSMTI